MLFTVGAVIQAASYSIAQMSVGRLVVGFGVGSAAMVVPLYIAEIAPTKVRGRLIGLNNMSITGGQVVSYGIGAAFAHVNHGWRYMVGLGAVPAIILACLLPLCPESPRQLGVSLTSNFLTSPILGESVLLTLWLYSVPWQNG